MSQHTYKNRDEWNQELLKHVVCYNISRFIGRGQYQKASAKTLEDAREVKKTIDSDAQLGGSEANIYAICLYMGYEHSVNIE